MRQLRLHILALLFLTALTAPRSAPAADAACGNRLLEPGETCDQCPADCAVQTCHPAKGRAVFAVEFTPPPAPDITTVVLRIGYRTDHISLPGKEAAKSVRDRLKSSDHAVMAVNDLDYALQVVAGRPKALPAGRLMTIEFDRCGGAPPPALTDLSCAVLSCANSSGLATDCSCKIVAVAP